MTRGAVVEFNRKDWALRAGFFQVPEAHNSDVLIFNSGGAVVEWRRALRHRASARQASRRRVHQPGQYGTLSHRAGFVATDPTININDAVADNRQQRWKYGYYANLEQALSKDLERWQQ
jgi:high affinity Mn2+ porin